MIPSAAAPWLWYAGKLLRHTGLQQQTDQGDQGGDAGCRGAPLQRLGLSPSHRNSDSQRNCRNNQFHR